MKITIICKPQRPKPKAGDRRVTKAHGLQIRVHDMAVGPRGSPIGRTFRQGRPCFTWMSPSDLATWDRHHLTPDERQKFFPPEREAGYMQMRGAA